MAVFQVNLGWPVVPLSTGSLSPPILEENLRQLPITRPSASKQWRQTTNNVTTAWLRNTCALSETLPFILHLQRTVLPRTENPPLRAQPLRTLRWRTHLNWTELNSRSLPSQFSLCGSCRVVPRRCRRSSRAHCCRVQPRQRPVPSVPPRCAATSAVGRRKDFQILSRKHSSPASLPSDLYTQKKKILHVALFTNAKCPLESMYMVTQNLYRVI